MNKLREGLDVRLAPGSNGDGGDYGDGGKGGEPGQGASGIALCGGGRQGKHGKDGDHGNIGVKVDQEGAQGQFLPARLTEQQFLFALSLNRAR